MPDTYTVKPLPAPLNHIVSVPGSKSITNRALLLASMAQGESVLTHVLFSDDSRSFMDCLDKLGYALTVDEPGKTVTLRGGAPCAKASVHVRNAGTSARFITALLAAHEGEYIVDASAQMKKRPMKPLLDVLHNLGCSITFMETDACLPFLLRGGKLSGGSVTLDSSVSSQFISALLMTGCLHANDLHIKPIGRENARSYVDITLTMMAQFGVCAKQNPDGTYTVKAGQTYAARHYAIEPDVSGACYFYAAAALVGGSMIVRGVHFTSMQGDIRFLTVLEQMGCTLTDTPEGIRLTAPENGALKGVEVDLSDCSDQTMTLAVLAAFASSPTTIKHVGHIRHQESDRIRAVATELANMGIPCDEQSDGLVIYPAQPKAAVIETYNDHRMAMAFALAGLRAEGIAIANPACTAKTFENYFDVIDSLYMPQPQPGVTL